LHFDTVRFSRLSKERVRGYKASIISNSRKVLGSLETLGLYGVSTR